MLPYVSISLLLMESLCLSCIISSPQEEPLFWFASRSCHMAVSLHGSKPRGGKASQSSRALLSADPIASSVVEGQEQLAAVAMWSLATSGYLSQSPNNGPSDKAFFVHVPMQVYLLWINTTARSFALLMGAQSENVYMSWGKGIHQTSAH